MYGLVTLVYLHNAQDFVYSSRLRAHWVAIGSKTLICRDFVIKSYN